MTDQPDPTPDVEPEPEPEPAKNRAARRLRRVRPIRQSAPPPLSRRTGARKPAYYPKGGYQ
jgi:hypothetical protein